MSLLGRWRKAISSAEKTVTQHSVLSLEQGHVRGAVLELTSGGVELLGVATTPVNGIGNGHPDVDRWAAGCDKVLTQAEDMTPNTRGRKIVPDHVAFSLPAEMTRAHPIVIRRERRAVDESITKEEVTSLLQRGYRQAQDSAPPTGDAPEDIVCGSVARIVVDEKVVDDPVGLHGGQIDLHLTFWLAPQEWIRALEVVAERLQLSLTTIVPEPLAYATPLTDTTALIVLLDDHHTVAGYARRGRLEWSTLVRMGERELSEAIAGNLELQLSQADALMRAYRARELREDVELSVARAFWLELRRWMAQLAESIQAVNGEGELPYRLYFSDLTHKMPEASKSLETPFWEQCLPFERCPEVTALGVGSVHDVVDCTAQAGGTAYLSLRTLAQYIARTNAPGANWDRALSEIIRGRGSNRP